MATQVTHLVVQAVEQIWSGVIPGVRGPGCAAIVMTDGRRYNVVGPMAPNMVERFSGDGELIERLDASEIDGEVARVIWTCDELGGIYID